MASQKKIDANRANSKLSTGPKRKNAVRLNAIKTGFFCKQLHIRQEEQPEYDALHDGICQQLGPETALQGIACDNVIACAWRCRQALQLDSTYLDTAMKASSQPAGERMHAPEELTVTEWYAANPRAMSAARRILEFAREGVPNWGRIPERFHEPIRTAFGQAFLDDLVTWQTSDRWALLCLEDQMQKCETFPQLTKREPSSDIRVVPDPKERADMVAKLLDGKLQQLDDLRHVLDQAALGSRSGAHSGLSRQYYPGAVKDLALAIDLFLDIRRAGL
jgi:hypothetical protein